MGVKPSKYETLEFDNNEFKININEYTEFPVPPLTDCILRLDNKGIHITHNDTHICSISWYKIKRWSNYKKYVTFYIIDNDENFKEYIEYNLELVLLNNDKIRILILVSEITNRLAEKYKLNSGKETDKVNINLEI
jgi:hypothetical protein